MALTGQAAATRRGCKQTRDCRFSTLHNSPTTRRNEGSKDPYSHGIGLMKTTDAAEIVMGVHG
jgi:hypothetical protein